MGRGGRFRLSHPGYCQVPYVGYPGNEHFTTWGKATYVTLTVFARPAKTPEEMGALSQIRSGSAVETVKITGGDCRTYKAKSGQTPFSCYVEAKGRGVVLDVVSPGSVPAAQVTPLVDKAVSRLP